RVRGRVRAAHPAHPAPTALIAPHAVTPHPGRPRALHPGRGVVPCSVFPGRLEEWADAVTQPGPGGGAPAGSAGVAQRRGQTVHRQLNACAHLRVLVPGPVTAEQLDLEDVQWFQVREPVADGAGERWVVVE